MSTTSDELTYDYLAEFVDRYNHAAEEAKKLDLESQELHYNNFLLDEAEELQKLLESDRTRYETEARLIELDLLEQAINQGRDMYEYKMQRLETLQAQLNKENS